MPIDIQQFLVSRTFAIPQWQRDFAWTAKQMQDLVDDIQEVVENPAATHYLGTIVLAGGNGEYQIVDGQQRLSALSLLIHALLEQLSPQDYGRIVYAAKLLYRDPSFEHLKLDFGLNKAFVKELFAGKDPQPSSTGQRRLKECYVFARDRAGALASQGGPALIHRWLDAISRLDVIHFVERDSGRAIRMFQTVNDRGLPLTTMDKAKSLLVFYSNRNLNGTLDDMINDCFRNCYAAYDVMRELVQDPRYRVDTIARETFSEDDILRYHYLAYWHQRAQNIDDFNGYTHTVFEGFLKRTLKTLSQDPGSLGEFIEDYVRDLSEFALGFKNLVTSITTNERLYKVLVVLGLSTRLYPLAIRLLQRNLLFSTIPGTNIDLLRCLEVCDVRVYKTRGTDPAKDIGDLSHRSRWADLREIANGLRTFVLRFMPDGLFRTRLGEDMYNNPAAALLLLAYDEYLAGRPYSIDDMVSLVAKQITREHIIPQILTSNITSYGFTDDEDYRTHLNKLGNLTLLSRAENSKCLNKPVHTKLTDQTLYASSVFEGTRRLAHLHGSGDFKKADIVRRTEELTKRLMSEYPIWPEC